MESLRASGLLRALRRVDGLQGPRMRVDGREVLMLAGANYLGLAGDPRVVEAAREATTRWGTAAGGARLISGNLDLHEALEERLAAFSGHAASLLFSTGYMANLGVVTTLAGPGDVVISDALNHASIVDACRLARADTRVFRHNDPDDLERLAAALPAQGNRLLIVDGVFSMDGDVARLAEIVRIAREHEMIVALDDAHGFGVLGARGRGAAEQCGVDVDLLIGNLGKALGSFGAFVACSAPVRDLLLNRARAFVFTCGLAPGPVGAALRSIEIVRDEPERRRHLLDLAARLREGLAAEGWDTGASTTHVVPVIVGDNERTMRLAATALERGVYAQGIRYPSVPEGTARLRLTPTALHEAADVDRVIDCFGALRDEA